MTGKGMQGDWFANARWFAAEIVVFVVGILIALALDTWWDERRDAARGLSYLVRIQEDLLADVDALEKRLVYFEGVQQFADDAIAYAETRIAAQWIVMHHHCGRFSGQSDLAVRVGQANV